MVEWMIGYYVKGVEVPYIIKRRIKTYKEAMQELRIVIDKRIVTTYNPSEKEKHLYNSIADIPIGADYVIFKVTKVIRYDIKCSLKMEAIPKELQDMVQAPKNGG